MLKPILFNTDMVRAILDGRKTCTRRVIKNLIVFNQEEETFSHKDKKSDIGYKVGLTKDEIVEYAPYQAGDILWVRETWKQYEKRVGKGRQTHLQKFYGYKADADNLNNPSEFYEGNWKPSIHMPKKAARIFLEVTSVRAERLQDITTEQILKEGVVQRFPKVNDRFTPDILSGGFIELWNSTIKRYERHKYGWKANPWVWVIEFKRVEMK